LLRVQVIGAVSIAFVFMTALMLTFSEGGGDFIALLFESVSAFGTVGLSTGVTPDLSYWGHLILIVAMFVGRLGPLTVGLAMARRRERDLYRFAQEQVTIG
jgi:trk system potassium uptake protein TrkH